MLRRRTVLTLFVVGVVPAFATVNGLVAVTRTTRAQLEREWASRAAAAAEAGRSSEAADDYYTAQVYARDHGRYRLDLARALIAAGRASEARAELDTLWADAPGSGEVNLELGRVSAGEGDVDGAVRYLHGAIDGAWQHDPRTARHGARLELARLFADRGLLPQAQAELGILLADPPIDPRAAALAGAIAFAQSDYRMAAERLREARTGGALDPAGEQMLEVSGRALALDPDAHGLTSRERVRRLVRLFTIALAASRRCPSDAAAPMRARLEAAAPQVNERALARDPDAVDATFELLAAAAGAVDAACPPADPEERAVALVLRRART
ncbi:MAG TPA: tetratricopeptide repeat protein [Vicinamibacterales bacterium]|nr:tetratricopeptide repeat protein [Vicinamibacterales bacterium]